MPLLADHMTREVQASRETLRGLPPDGKPSDSEQGELLRFVIERALPIFERLTRLWSWSVARIGMRQVEDYRSEGAALLALFDGCAGLAAELERTARQQAVAVADEQTMDRVREGGRVAAELAQRVRAEWPFFTEDSARRALAEHERGQTKHLDELAAELAGDDPEGWVRALEGARRHRGG
jgi:hypothetical protein